MESRIVLATLLSHQARWLCLRGIDGPLVPRRRRAGVPAGERHRPGQPRAIRDSPPATLDDPRFVVLDEPCTRVFPIRGTRLAVSGFPFPRSAHCPTVWLDLDSHHNHNRSHKGSDLELNRLALHPVLVSPRSPEPMR